MSHYIPFDKDFVLYSCCPAVHFCSQKVRYHLRPCLPAKFLQTLDFKHTKLSAAILLYHEVAYPAYYAVQTSTSSHANSLPKLLGVQTQVSIGFIGKIRIVADS